MPLFLPLWAVGLWPRTPTHKDTGITTLGHLQPWGRESGWDVQHPLGCAAASVGSGQVSLSAESQRLLWRCSSSSCFIAPFALLIGATGELETTSTGEASDAVGPLKVPRAHSERVCDITGRSAV